MIFKHHMKETPTSSLVWELQTFVSIPVGKLPYVDQICRCWIMLNILSIYIIHMYIVYM